MDVEQGWQRGGAATPWWDCWTKEPNARKPQRVRHEQVTTSGGYAHFKTQVRWKSHTVCSRCPWTAIRHQWVNGLRTAQGTWLGGLQGQAGRQARQVLAVWDRHFLYPILILNVCPPLDVFRKWNGPI